MIYRSTLDPSLRMEEDGINPAVWWIGAAVLAYITATPGPLQSVWDMYIVAPFKSLTEPTLRRKDVNVGRKLAQGGFGTVFLGTSGANISGKIRKGQKIIIKKATEFGEAEVWMNERLTRAAPQSIATFLTAYSDGPPRLDTPLALVWKFEGKLSLFDAIQARNFPVNLEEGLLGRELRIEDKTMRSSASIKVITRQILQNLADIHETGIVHRDVKPQNMILSKKGIKMIDLGAAADLRIGINYVPNEYLLDPRYAPPEQYIMSPLTPKAPPTPVAALLSPVLWRINQPDRFDVYSAGIVLMQMAFPNLRNDTALINFRNKLEDCDHDIDLWRSTVENAAQYAEGFKLMDAEGGAGWELVRQLVAKRPSMRLSAKEALKHPWLVGTTGASAAEVVTKGITSAVDDSMKQMADYIPVSRSGSLSEAELYSALNGDDQPQPEQLRQMPRTIAWWQERAKRQQSNSLISRVLRAAEDKIVRVSVRPTGGFATQRAMGIPLPENGANGRGKREETDEDREVEEKQPAGVGLLSILNRSK